MNEVGCLMCRGKIPPPGSRCKTCRRAGPPLGHTCHAKGCKVEIPPKMLMCLPHWKLVPRELQRAVWREYVPGQEIRKNPTAAYLDVMKQAIEAVAKREAL